jgi:hypothetical protein
MQESRSRSAARDMRRAYARRARMVSVDAIVDSEKVG